MSNIPDSFRGSNALQLVQSRGWKYEIENESRIRVSECPWCGPHSKPGFQLNIHGTDSDRRGYDGIFFCHHCGKTGSLRDIQEHLGVTPTQTIDRHRSESVIQKEREQEERRVWRVLYWHLKAMFEAADSGVIDIRDVILPYIVTKDGRTLSEHITPKMPEIMSIPTDRLLPEVV